jgi:hypothetical protein
MLNVLKFDDPRSLSLAIQFDMQGHVESWCHSEAASDLKGGALSILRINPRYACNEDDIRGTLKKL